MKLPYDENIAACHGYLFGVTLIPFTIRPKLSMFDSPQTKRFENLVMTIFNFSIPSETHHNLQSLPVDNEHFWNNRLLKLLNLIKPNFPLH